jgi:hypothetical protein
MQPRRRAIAAPPATRSFRVHIRLGELLTQLGVLNATQVDRILSAQRETGEPFGVLCERLAGVDPVVVEEAWATQYAGLTRHIDPTIETVDPSAIELVTRRQAWQFRVLPVRFDDQELMLATTRKHLRRALRFATTVLAVPVFPVMADPSLLGKALCRHYPLPGMTPEAVDDDALDRLLALARSA